MTESRELPCKECGAPLTFAPGQGMLVCEFCGTENEIEGDGAVISPWGTSATPAPQIKELDYRQALADALDATEVEETATIRCEGCGAEVSFDSETLADECPFCATPLARNAEKAHRHPKPQAVLPFAIDDREAKQKLSDWLGSLWFAPNGLKKFAEAGRPLNGVYLPHYTYDAVGDAAYTGQRGDAYYVTRTRTVTRDGKTSTETYQERRIRWSPRSGEVRHVFDDVLVQASETMGPLGDQAEYGGRSWDLFALEPYRTEFLAGFRAEVPSVPLEQGYDRAQDLMGKVLVRDVNSTLAGMSSASPRWTPAIPTSPSNMCCCRFGSRPIGGRTNPSAWS